MLPREFRMAGGGFGRMALPFALMLVFFGAIMLLLFSIFTGLAGGIIAAIVGPLALLGVLYRKFSRMKSGTVVRFSEYGVELSDAKGFRVRLAWPDITRIGQVLTQMANPDAIGEQGGLQVSVGAMQSQGIIGWGERVVPPNAPSWLRENLATQPTNPADGRPEVAIPLSGIDPNWLRGPMAEWIRIYRPDLLGGGPAGYAAPDMSAAGTGSHAPFGHPPAGYSASPLGVSAPDVGSHAPFGHPPAGYSAPLPGVPAPNAGGDVPFGHAPAGYSAPPAGMLVANEGGHAPIGHPPAHSPGGHAAPFPGVAAPGSGHPLVGGYSASPPGVSAPGHPSAGHMPGPSPYQGAGPQPNPHRPPVNQPPPGPYPPGYPTR